MPNDGQPSGGGDSGRPEAAVRSVVPAAQTATQAANAYEPAPPGRSKKRKTTTTAASMEEMVRLGEPVERNSERLMRGVRPVKLSAEDKAPQITLDEAQMVATSSKGYRMVRATHGAHKGTWYYEVHIGKLGDTGAVRLGWATRISELQAPVGSDAGGYAICSVDGSKVHEGIREAYGSPFKEGDVVGCMLHMPPGGQPHEKTIDDVVRYKGQLYFTEDEEPVEPQPLPGSFLQFYVNGVPQGPAYEDIQEGTYYPAISLFTHAHQADPACVSVEFDIGEFKHPVPSPEKNGGNIANSVAKMAEIRGTRGY